MHEQIRYKAPREVMEEGDLAQHHIDLVINGKKVAGAELDYFSKPLPFYQLTDLYVVDRTDQGRKYSSRILDEVGKWLKARKKPGVVLESTKFLSDHASGMYERHGWTPVPDTQGLHVYNWPADVSLSILRGYEMRGYSTTE